MATWTGLQNDSQTITTITKYEKKRERLGWYPPDRFEHISFRRPVSLIHSEGTWKDMKAKWKEHRGNECKMKGDERKWKQKMTSADSRPRMLSHPQNRKLENSHFLSTGGSPPEKTIGAKKQTITWSWVIWKDTGFLYNPMYASGPNISGHIRLQAPNFGIAQVLCA